MLKSLIHDHQINDYIFNMNLAKTSSIMIEMYNQALADLRPNYNSPLNQLQFLKLLTLIANPKKILELGGYRRGNNQSRSENYFL